MPKYVQTTNHVITLGQAAKMVSVKCHYNSLACGLEYYESWNKTSQYRSGVSVCACHASHRYWYRLVGVTGGKPVCGWFAFAD